MITTIFYQLLGIATRSNTSSLPVMGMPTRGVEIWL